MELTSLIDKFKPKRSGQSRVYAVVQPHAIYFSSDDSSLDIPDKLSIGQGEWTQLLQDVLAKLPQSAELDVVLHPGLYQDFQIDKPNLPKEEWNSALPFLLKDLTSERVSDLVADAFELPNTNKLQVYVVSKSLVLNLNQIALSQGHVLDRVLIEDDIWGLLAGELNHFLLLQRSEQGSYQLRAYVNNRCVFHRTLRGVIAPVSGPESGDLALDGAALELQRSIDYLSSQLKGASLHHLKISCDGEDNLALADSLADRVSVKVSSLDDDNTESGVLVVSQANLLRANYINLYPQHLKPKKEYLTLGYMVASWCVVAAVLLLVSGFFHYQASQLEQSLASHQAKAATLSSQLSRLQVQLQKHQPAAEKVAAVARLKNEIQSKKDSLKAVGEYDESQQLGYSGVMKSLAEIGRNDISLNSITMNANSLDIVGLARNAQAIPSWINQFKTELNLVGRTFEKLKISRNEQQLITFELKSKQGTN
ncbi:MSHA biogenesis protein MshI [Vibrio sp. S4M6]|uniref:MSHA biogenesis protein MshI n=1 Tax=Vibrio sinus TaxID=2946865 RepID=UPI002029B66B|nr:MSHA biogenesis protein MshI [Vibrio sinus]MCL9780521.1 MSHA biogenesis protein MshI [Vibrio sinus]